MRVFAGTENMEAELRWKCFSSKIYNRKLYTLKYNLFICLLFHTLHSVQSISTEYTRPLSAVLHATCCFLLRGAWGGGSLLSMVLVVWPCCSRSSLRLWVEVWLLFVRLSLLNGTPVSPNTGFLHKRIHVAISLCTTNTPRPTPPGLVTQLPVEWRVALHLGLLYKTPPPPTTRVKAIEEQLGRLLFWHSLYVLLIGANWHREDPLFPWIILPSFPRREERGANKRSGQKGGTGQSDG